MTKLHKSFLIKTLKKELKGNYISTIKTTLSHTHVLTHTGIIINNELPKLFP